MSEIAIKVHKVHKAFKLPHEKHGSIKSLFINRFRRARTFERQQVLEDVSFEVNKGDFFAIVGRNGGGKSTLLKLLAGIYTPDKGSIHVEGKLVPFIELGVGFNPELTGRENVFLNCALLGFSRAETEEMYDSVVEFAELERFMDQKLKNYSSGMQVRLAFSVAIRARGDILLLDEVLAVGDAAFQQKCFDYFEELKRQKQTVVFVSHDMGAVKRFCNKAIYVKDGEIIKAGAPADIADLYAENNINTGEVSKEDEEGPKLSKSHSIRARLGSQTKSSVTLEITYDSADKEGMYVGIALVKDGVPIAELTTDLDRPLLGKGNLTYTLDTELLNPGAYQLTGVSLFKLENRGLLAISKSRNEFAVKGDDIRRGGAIKLGDTWAYDQN